MIAQGQKADAVVRAQSGCMCSFLRGREHDRSRFNQVLDTHSHISEAYSKANAEMLKKNYGILKSGCLRFRELQKTTCKYI